MSENFNKSMAREHIPSLVMDWIRQKAPGAVVRFGEGEGRLLYARPDDDQSISVACKKLFRQTGIRFSSKEMFKVRSIILNAFDEADVVGIKGDASFKEEHKGWISKIESMFEERASVRRRPSIVTHCLVSVDLYNNLSSLLDGQQKISVISCRNLAPVIEERYGVKDICVYQIPSQYIVREVDDEYEAALHGVRIWPGFYSELRSSLKVREPGEIFLVGGGLFGKDLCIRIRELGGIALDLGSCLDKMAGKATRGRKAPHRQRLIKANSLSSDFL